MLYETGETYCKHIENSLLDSSCLIAWAQQ